MGKVRGYDRKRVVKHLIPNVIFFPLIVLGAVLILGNSKSYKTFREISELKMFRWQWFVLDHVMRLLKRY